MVTANCGALPCRVGWSCRRRRWSPSVVYAAAVALCGGVMIRFLRRRRRRAIDFVYKLRFCSRHLFHHASSSERDDHNITRHITARSLLAVFMVANNLFMPLWPSLFREFNHLYVRVSNSRISE